MRVDLVAVELDHLARLRADEVGAGQNAEDQTRARLGDLDLQRVAVQRLQAFDRRVVVEGLFAVERGLAHLGQAEDLVGVDPAPERTLVGRVGDALVRIDVVLRRDLAARTLERRVAREVDAGRDLDGPGAEVGGCRRHAIGHQRTDLDRPRQMVVLVERLEDVRRDVARIEVAHLGRVERRFGAAKCDVQHPPGVGAGSLGGQRCQREQHGSRGAQAAQREGHWGSGLAMST